jgi:hypothetical protein
MLNNHFNTSWIICTDAYFKGNLTSILDQAGPSLSRQPLHQVDPHHQRHPTNNQYDTHQQDHEQLPLNSTSSERSTYQSEYSAPMYEQRFAERLFARTYIHVLPQKFIHEHQDLH